MTKHNMFGCLRNNINYYKMAVDHKYHQRLNENDALVDLCNTARAPAKDFFHIFVSPTEVIFTRCLEMYLATSFIV